MRATYLSWAAALSLLAAGCECSSSSLGTPCTLDTDCDGNLVCDPDTDTCQMAAVDAGMTTDAGGTAIDGAMPDAGPACLDADGDGSTTCAGDCDDADPLTSTTALEICGDGIDNDCNAQPDDGCTGGIGTYVSQLTGLDTNPGTRALPVQTIGQGITNAMTLGGPQAVIVAEGTYAEAVTLVEGVDLLGGFQCDTSACAWTRDPSANVSTIENTTFAGVLAPAGLTNATLLEGFTIVGLDGSPSAFPGSAGIQVSGGAPTIRGNVVVGGGVLGGSADRSVGISLRSSNGVVLEGNDASGGASVRLSAGILIDGGSAGMTVLATIRENVIRGGTGDVSAGIVAWNSVAGTLVADNDIFAGDSTGDASFGIQVGSTLTITGNRINADPARVGTCASPTRWCAGIFSASSTSTITNNVIYGPFGPQSAGVFLGEFEIAAGAVILNGNAIHGGGAASSSNTTQSAALVLSIGTCTSCGFVGEVGRIRNNILDAGANANRYGMLEDPAAGRQMHPEIVENNLFYFPQAGNGTDVLYRAIVAPGGLLTAVHLDIDSLNRSTSMPMASANIAGDPLLDATWHLMSGSPCIDAGTATEAASFDFDGDPRPNGSPVDIGPDET